MAAAPNKDGDSWCHLQETMTMLQLTSAQIRSSMLDGENSISELTDTLQSIAALADKVDALLDSDPEAARVLIATMKSNVNEGVVACQFHDRVTQRLDHVTTSLGKIASIVTTPEQLEDFEQWRALQESMSNSYTMESERLMFEQIMMGRSVDEALELYRHHFSTNQDDSDEVELF
jgi:hypothetical protein